MKKIRHQLILFVVATVFISIGCGSDSTSTEPPMEGDKIIGTWNLVSLVATINGQKIDVTDLDPCLLTTTLLFEADGGFRTTYATSTGTGNNGCTEEGNSTGTWKLESGTTYTIHGGRYGTGTRTLIFSSNNNTFSFTETSSGEFGGKATFTYERE